MSLRCIGTMCILLVLTSGCVSGEGDEPEVQTATPTIRSTHTPRPTGTKIPTLTPIIRTPTKMPAPTATPRSDLPLAAMTIWYYQNYILLIDTVSGGVFETIPFELDGYELQLLNWSEKTCELTIAHQETGPGKIVYLNIRTKEAETIFDSIIPSNREGHINETYLSPDNEWAAYATGKLFNEGHHPNYLELYVARRGTDLVATRVSVAGNSFLNLKAVDWSIDNLLAYSEQDSEGIYQIFTYDPITGIKRQVSQFQESDRFILEIHWSPDGTRILFSSSSKLRSGNPSEGIHNFGVIDIAKNLFIPGTIDGRDLYTYSKISWLQWSNDDTIAVRIFIGENASGADQRGTYFLRYEDWSVTSHFSLPYFLVEYRDWLVQLDNSILYVNRISGTVEHQAELDSQADWVHSRILLEGTEPGGPCRPTP